MVVIARNRFVFKILENYLKEKNIPFALKKGERSVEPSTLFGQVLDYAIRLKRNPKDWINSKKLHQKLKLKEPRTWPEDTLQNLAKQVEKSTIKNARFLAKLISSIDTLDVETPNIPKFIQEFKGHLARLIQDDDNVSIQNSEDIKLSLEELNEFSRAWTLFKRKGLGDSLIAFSNTLALGQLAENNQEHGLILSTVHTMKGLEKDIVFLIGMCEGVFPDYRAISPEELDEERNNAFVAVTRAKRWLYVTYPKQRKMPWGDNKSQKPSCFIQEMQQIT